MKTEIEQLDQTQSAALRLARAINSHLEAVEDMADAKGLLLEVYHSSGCSNVRDLHELLKRTIVGPMESETEEDAIYLAELASNIKLLLTAEDLQEVVA